MKLNKSFKTRFSLAVATGCLCLSAQAAIILDDAGFYTSPTGGGFVTLNSADLGTFDANGSDKILVSVNGERNGSSGTGDVISVTYGGVSLTRAETAFEAGRRYVSIWYADNIAVSGDLVIDTNNARGVGVGVVALSNTQAGIVDTVVTGESLSTTAGDFVFAAAYANGGTPPSIVNLTPLFSGDTGSSAGSGGYATAGGASFTPDFTGELNFAGVSVSEAIIAVPEPSATALLSLGGLALTLRRRR